MSAGVGSERGSSQTPEFHLGCQTITWDNDRTAKRDYTVKAVADAGYDGVEIGARFLDLDHPEEFKTVLDDCGIRLVALHTGWNPFLDSGADGAGSEVERAIEFGQVTGTPYLVMSGRDNEEFVAGIPELNAIGERSRRAGMTFCYHNHWWEVQDNARLLKHIERDTDPELVKFCPDIGWIRKTTPQVTDVLDVIASRIRLVHFKDYVADGVEIKDNETEFGEGILDFEECFAYLRQLPVTELWVIAEQWKSSMNRLVPEESIRRNRVFLNGLANAER